MPSASDDCDGSLRGLKHNPLQVLNKSPEFFQHQPAINQSKITPSRLAESRLKFTFAASQTCCDGGDEENTTKIPTRGIHTQNGNIHSFDTHNTDTCNGAEEKPKISVRERVQLWNKQNNNAVTITNQPQSMSSPKIQTKQSKASIVSHRKTNSKIHNLKDCADNRSAKCTPKELSGELSSEEIIEASSLVLTQASQRLKELRERSPKTVWIKGSYGTPRPTASLPSSVSEAGTPSQKISGTVSNLAKNKKRFKEKGNNFVCNGNSAANSHYEGRTAPIHRKEIKMSDTKPGSGDRRTLIEKEHGSELFKKKQNSKQESSPVDERASRVSVKRMVSFIRKGGFNNQMPDGVEKLVEGKTADFLDSRNSLNATPEFEKQPHRHKSLSIDSGHGTSPSHGAVPSHGALQSQYVAKKIVHKLQKEETSPLNSFAERGKADGKCSEIVVPTSQGREESVMLPNSSKPGFTDDVELECQEHSSSYPVVAAVHSASNLHQNLRKGSTHTDPVVQVTSPEQSRFSFVKPKPFRPEVKNQKYIKSERKVSHVGRLNRNVEETNKNKFIEFKSSHMDNHQTNIAMEKAQIGNDVERNVSGVVFAKKVFIEGEQIDKTDETQRHNSIGGTHDGICPTVGSKKPPAQTSFSHSECSSKQTSPSKKETYSCLTTVGINPSDGEKRLSPNLNSSFSIAVEVEVESDDGAYENLREDSIPTGQDSPDNAIQVISAPDKFVSKSIIQLKLSEKLKKSEKVDHSTDQEHAAKPPVAYFREKQVRTPGTPRSVRGKGGHQRFPSKSSIASTLSVSFHRPSEGSVEAVEGNRSYHSKHDQKEADHSIQSQQHYSNFHPNQGDLLQSNPRHRKTSRKSNSRRSRSVPPPEAASFETVRTAKLKSIHMKSGSEVSVSSSVSSKSNLNSFFDSMGLEKEVLVKMMQPVEYDDDVFQDMHVWQVGSSGESAHSEKISGGSKVSENGMKQFKKLNKLPDQSTSIVAKNARIIKWLSQCKKARLKSI